MNKNNKIFKQIADSKSVLVMYHTDLDGDMSAAIIEAFMQQKLEVCYESRFERFDFQRYNYGWDLPYEWETYETIIAVDISFGEDHPEVYSHPGLIWIDHHHTAIQYEKEHPELHKIPGLRREGVGACMLAWEFFLGQRYEIPDIVTATSLTDVWDDRDPELFQWAREIKEGLRFKHPDYLELSNLIFEEDNSFGELGRELIESKNQKITTYIDEVSLVVKLNGHNTLTLGGCELGCDVFAILDEHFKTNNIEIIMYYRPYRDDDKLREKVTLISKKNGVDVSEIAKSYGGGGHKNAAGFTVTESDLQSLLRSGIGF